MTMSTDIDLDALSNNSDADHNSKESKKLAVMSDLEHALMVKRHDPLQYYNMKMDKKMPIHDESFKKLIKLTKKDKEGSFSNKMFELLEKTNERVHLDRPFLIREKMQVIMLDSE